MLVVVFSTDSRRWPRRFGLLGGIRSLFLHCLDGLRDLLRLQLLLRLRNGLWPAAASS
jgi:hypothetical protein